MIETFATGASQQASVSKEKQEWKVSLGFRKDSPLHAREPCLARDSTAPKAGIFSSEFNPAGG
jgi:hypothetical protein